MLRITQLKLPAEHTEQQLKERLLKTLRISPDDLTGRSDPVFDTEAFPRREEKARALLCIYH